MATLKINLVSREVDKIVKTNIWIDRLRILSRVILGGFTLVIVSLFGWFFWTNREAQQVDQNVDLVLQRLGEKTAVEVSYRRYQNVLAEAREVIEARKDFQAILTDVYALLPVGVTVESVNFVGENVVLLAARARGVQTFSQAVDRIQSLVLGAGGRFNQAVLTSVSRSGSGDYVFKVELGISKKT